MGYKLGALSWDKDFRDFFEIGSNSSEIKIHSVFSRVINITSSEGVLYTIANKNTDNAPYTLRLDFEKSFKDIINKEDKITIDKGSIMIGNLEIYLSDLSMRKNERVRLSDFFVSNIKKNIEMFDELIIESGERGGCKAYYLHHFLGMYKNSENLIEKEVRKRIESFYNDLMDNKLDENSIKKLVGLGAGLTPSGDDFLTGFLASVGVFDCNRNLVEMIRSYIYPLLNSTTDISGAMLKAALEDKYREFLNEFVYSFFGYDNEEFIKAFKNLLTIGSSSGTDMCVGVLVGFLYTIERIEGKGGILNGN